MKIFSTKWQTAGFSANGVNKTHPIGRKLNAKNLVARIDVDAIEAAEMLEIEEEGSHGPVKRPFGWRYAEWDIFKAQTNPAKLWAFKLVNADSEWCTHHWEGLVEKRLLGFGAVWVTRTWTEIIKEYKSEPLDPLRHLDLGEKYSIPAFIRRQAE